MALLDSYNAPAKQGALLDGRCERVVAVDPLEGSKACDSTGQELVSALLHFSIWHMKQIAVHERRGLHLRSSALASGFVATQRGDDAGYIVDAISVVKVVETTSENRRIFDCLA